MSDAMTTGEFSARSNLTMKALRLYDAKGLLPPARVDPRTGFRYYSREQLGLARRITLLRAVGMPLSEVARVLELDGPAAVRAVSDHWRRLEDEHRARQSVLAYLRHVFLGDTGNGYEVRERDVPEQRVAFVQSHVGAGDLAAFITGASRDLFAHLTEAGACLSGPPFTVFHGAVSDDYAVPVEVCLPTDGPLDPRGRIGLRVEPAHREAYVEVAKGECAYPAIVAAYDAVRAWLDARDLAQCLPAREIYHPSWETAAPEDHAADVAFPFTPPGRGRPAPGQGSAGIPSSRPHSSSVTSSSEPEPSTTRSGCSGGS
ncbi:MerR family transcriptional regulator [Nonomuraea pusilla]|uniref:DNA-binding transcriptional regulator, MerR family n=1 Tax=Nonomuraea pusilla TaxID=46177 RepID=A0A1H7IE95_9ACTN|nr:MerR family transcriptional regulator [Nonomuraea pusilla]SEK59840.1 DNA-binding transcriptional regulator, MerR family [Nonomuraea pusilla]